jgi:3-hydroxyacyl-[acyl-carrier-protein] dehydratase
MEEINKMELDIKGIMEYLPHRYPFLLVDRVLEVEKNKRLVAIKNVSINENYFQGHFPSAPIMPGVLVVEALAQAAGILATVSLDMKGIGGIYFMSMNNTKFRSPVVPGDQLTLEVEVMQCRRNVWKIHGRALVGEKLCTEGDFTAMVTDKEIA